MEDVVESLTDSLLLCDRAADQENEIRRNLYEDISVVNDSSQVVVSLKDLISAKRIEADENLSEPSNKELGRQTTLENILG